MVLHNAFHAFQGEQSSKTQRTSLTGLASSFFAAFMAVIYSYYQTLLGIPLDATLDHLQAVDVFIPRKSTLTLTKHMCRMVLSFVCRQSLTACGTDNIILSRSSDLTGRMLAYGQ
eukprot:scaffold289789_cov34-Prasinocladus_malaysianus.AAC.1